MRILVYGINYAPERTGIGKYTAEMSEWLAQAGAEVTVVAAPPYYPAWRVAPPYRATRYRHESLRGVAVVRCPIWVPADATGLKRLLHLASFALSSAPVVLWHALRARPDVVLAIEPPLFAAPVAWLAARLTGAFAWLHVQDFEIDAAFDLGLLRSDRLRRLFRSVERGLMRRFDRVSTIAGGMLQRLRDKGVADARATLFENWVDLERIRPLDRPSALRAALCPGDGCVVLYSGNMGRKQGLETVLEAAALLLERQPDIRFVLCGDGAARADIERAAQGRTNVDLRPLVAEAELNELLNAADIHVLPQRAGAADAVFPSKLTGMLASGRPVVATAAADSQIGAALADCGVVVPPGDAAALARALESLAADAGRRRTLGAAARREAVRRWDKDRVLAAAFGEWLNRRPGARDRGITHVAGPASEAAPTGSRIT